MKRLLTAFTITLLLAACSSSTTGVEDSKYPIQVGTWQVESEDSSSYIGQASQPKTAINETQSQDTIIISNPETVDMSIKGYVENGQHKFTFTFVDSGKIVPDSTLYAVPIIGLENQGYGGTWNVDWFRSEIEYVYDCESNSVPNTDITLELFDLNEDKLETILIFKNEGFIDVVEHNVCGKEI